MCGVAGILFTDGRVVDRDELKAFTNRLVHRGPDASGVFCDGQVGLGHRRLSIIDLEDGKQPMSNEDGKLCVTYNGEIYNYKELTVILKEKGHRFKTHSDTEVLVHAYEEWGEGCLEHLRGMFAFAIWDKPKRRLFLARDRFGLKPLYYYQQNGMFAFASEMQAFKALRGYTPSIDLQSIDMYLQFQYIPAPNSIFKEVRKLPPAHYMFIEQDGNMAGPTQYWDVEFKPDDTLDEAEWLERMDAALSETVERHLVSDVDFGAFLSGGVDSSTIVAYMSQIMDQPVKTFTIGSGHKGYDESSHARKVSELLSTEHYEQQVQPDAMEVLPELVRHYGEPFADSSALATWYVSRLASQQVKMVLSGDGGDELFAGYHSYPSVLWHHRKPDGFLPRVRHQAANIARKTGLYPSIPSAQDNIYQRMAYFDTSQRKELWNEQYHSLIRITRSFFDSAFLHKEQPDLLSQIQYYDIKNYIAYDNLTKVDVASMCHGLEVRVPMLDQQFWELARTVPLGMKLKKKPGFDVIAPDSVICKYILKKNGERFFSPDFMQRPKQGFEIPLRPWFAGPLRGMLKERLLSSGSQLGDYFDLDYIDNLISDHSEKNDHAWRLWALLVLDEWLRQNKDIIVTGEAKG